MKLKSFNSSTLLYWLIGIFVIATILVSLQSYSFGTRISNGTLFSEYNNYLIFKTSATHLWEGKDLYILHPKDHFDLYKYSPLFALLMAPFTLLPDWLGIIIWNLINLAALVAGLLLLPNITKKQTAFILLIAFFELIGSLMNEQSNALMTGLMLLGLAYLEKDKPLWATFFLMLSVYIKLFSIVVFMIVMFYRSRYRSILYAAFWMLLFAFLPALVTGWEGLKATYTSWLNMLQNDYSNSVGFSVLGIMVKWFNYQGSRNIVFFSGVLIMVLPLLKTASYKIRSFRYAVFSALLIWVIIFNHKAESPTFIIAMTGIGFYLVTQQFTLDKKILLILSIIFVSLVYSDLMPPAPRNNFFYPYFIKAFPCIVVWANIIYDVLFDKLHPLKTIDE